MNDQYFTYQEIKSQTSAWHAAIDLAIENTGDIKDITDKFDHVIFTGCGSSFYLSLATAELYRRLTGKFTQAVPGGELFLNPANHYGLKDRCLLVAISRSGTTTETIKAVEMFKKAGNGDVLVISNYDEVLAKLADYCLVIPEGQEQSVAQTRSFSSMFVTATALCVIAGGRKDLLDAMRGLPDAGAKLMQSYELAGKTLGEDLHYHRFYFLGSGENYGLACEANLKMKEMTLTDSEPFHFLEFRHGPMSMVDEKTVLIGLLSKRNASHEMAVLSEMKAKGGHVLTLGEDSGDVQFDSKLPEEIRGVLYLPILQLVAFYRSISKGLNPDKPRNLTSVVKLTL